MLALAFGEPHPQFATCSPREVTPGVSRSEEKSRPVHVGRAPQPSIGYPLTMSRFDRITVDPKKLNGQPCIRGLRITVRRVLEALATYPDREELRQEYPELEDADIQQALGYAAAALDDRVTDLPAA